MHHRGMREEEATVQVMDATDSLTPVHYIKFLSFPQSALLSHIKNKQKKNKP